MSRLPNNTTTVEEVLMVRDQALALLRDIADIQYVMTGEEQRGIYSLIRNLEFETWDTGRYPEHVRETADRPPGTALKELLSKLNETKQ
jgi:hypothetical protein